MTKQIELLLTHDDENGYGIKFKHATLSAFGNTPAKAAESFSALLDGLCESLEEDGRELFEVYGKEV